MAEDAVIGTLKIILGADAAGLVEGLAKSKEALGEFKSESEVTMATVNTLGVALASTAAIFLAEFVKSGFEAINTQYELAEQIGTTTESVQVLDRAAQMSGSSAEAMNASMKRLTATLGTVQTQGAGPAYDALQRLGLSAKTLSTMNLDVQLQTIAKRMEDLGYSSTQTAAVLKDLGLRGGALMGVFQNGGEVIGEARDQLDKFGASVNDIDARNVHNAVEAFETLGVILDGVRTQLAVALAPVIQEVANYLDDAGLSGKNMAAIIQPAVMGIVLDFGQFEDAIQQTKTSLEGLVLTLKAWPALFDKVFGDGTHALEDFNDAEDQFAADMAKPLPSDAIKKWVADVQTGTAEVGDAAAQARAELDKMFGGADTGPSKADQAASDKLDAQLKTLESSLGSTVSMENASYQKRLDDLKMFQQNGKITQEQYNDMTEKAGQDHADKLRQINAQSFQEQMQDQYAVLDQVSSTLDAIGSALQSSGQDNFNIAKVFSVATALMKGYESVTSSYAAGAAIGGPVVGAIFAGLAAAATAAQIAQLMSVQSTSSGTPNTAGASTAASQATAAVQTSQAASASSSTPGPNAGQTMTVRGIDRQSLFAGDGLRDLVNNLLQYQRDGGTVVLQ